jgi:eukaryotic-like serine/threonine-protein kinase
VTTYPSTGDYTLVLQNPETAFAVEDLRTATIEQGPLGPYGISGSSAVVFHASIGDDQYALRCYTRRDASTPERYAAFESYIAGKGLRKYIGNVTWYEEAVRVKGASWPVLKMEWIAGQQLNEYASYLADNGNRAALRTLSARWLELLSDLQGASFAHGDLQHGNILVDQRGHLRLVDFDSVWIPPLQGQAAPAESGHPSYQPQAGPAQSRWGPFMDTFSGLVIYLALVALAADPGLWPKFNNGDNLLFERSDFAPPFETDVWKHLRDLSDPDVDRTISKLKGCCQPAWVASQTVRDVLKPAWWDQPGGSAPTGTSADTPQTTSPTTAKTTPTAAKWYEAPAPSKPAAPGKPAVPSQATAPAGSLPPPLSTPYQSTLAPQSAAPLPSSTISPGNTTSRGKTTSQQSWWTQQQSKAPAGKVPNAPAKPQSQAITTLGLLLILLGIVGAVILAGVHQGGLAGFVGLLLIVPGIAITTGNSRTPPSGPTTP